MTLNPYDVPSTVSVAQTKRKAIASKMVWAGILLLGFALGAAPHPAPVGVD